MTLTPRLRAVLLLLLKLGLLAAALWFVFRRLSPRQVAHVLTSVRPGWLGLAVALFAVSKWLTARRLNYFQRTHTTG